MTDQAPQQQIQMSQKSLQAANNSIGYSTQLINMSLQQLWNVAYTAGYEDAMEIIKTDQGMNYFVRQYIKMGVFVGGANLELVPEEEGKKGVSECNLAK